MRAVGGLVIIALVLFAASLYLIGSAKAQSCIVNGACNNEVKTLDEGSPISHIFNNQVFTVTLVGVRGPTTVEISISSLTGAVQQTVTKDVPVTIAGLSLIVESVTPAVGFTTPGKASIRFGEHSLSCPTDCSPPISVPLTISPPFGISDTLQGMVNFDPTITGNDTETLVLWEKYSGSQTLNKVMGQIIDNNGNKIGPNFELTQTAGLNARITAQKGKSTYLVLWEDMTQQQTVDTRGVYISSLPQLTTTPMTRLVGVGSNRRPSIAYNPKTDQYVIAHFRPSIGSQGNILATIIGGSSGGQFFGTFYMTPLGDYPDHKIVYDAKDDVYILFYISGSTPMAAVYDPTSLAQMGSSVVLSQQAAAHSSLVTDGDILVVGGADGLYLVSWADWRSGAFVETFAKVVKFDIRFAAGTPPIKSFIGLDQSMTSQDILLTRDQSYKIPFSVAYNNRTNEFLTIWDGALTDFKLYGTIINVSTKAIKSSFKIAENAWKSGIRYNPSMNKFILGYTTMTMSTFPTPDTADIVGYLLNPDGSVYTAPVTPPPQTGNRYIAPTHSSTKNSFVAATSNADLDDGDLRPNDETIFYIHDSMALLNQNHSFGVLVYALFKQGHVNMSNFKIYFDQNDLTRIAVDKRSATGINNTYAIVLPNLNNGSGVYVCLDALGLASVRPTCPNKLEFKPPFPRDPNNENILLTSPTVFVDLSDMSSNGQDNYLIGGLTGTGVGLITNTTPPAANQTQTLLDFFNPAPITPDNKTWEFAAAYTYNDTTTGNAEFVPNAVCTINFGSGPQNMVYQPAPLRKHVFNQTYNRSVSVSYTVSCSESTGVYQPQAKSSNVDITITSLLVDNPPTAEPKSPTDNKNFTEKDISFICEAKDDNGLSQITLRTSIPGKERTDKPVISLPNQTKSETFQLTGINNGNYNWYCEATDNANQVARSTETRRLTVDAPVTPPTNNCADTDYDYTLTPPTCPADGRQTKTGNRKAGLTCEPAVKTEIAICIPTVPKACQDSDYTSCGNWTSSCVDGKQTRTCSKDQTNTCQGNATLTKTKSCQQQAAPFDMTLIIIIVVVIIAAIGGVMFFLKRRKAKELYGETSEEEVKDTDEIPEY